VPAVLAVVLGPLIALAVAVLVRGGARRRLSNLATLTVLGLTSGQRRTVLLWSSGAIAVPTLLIGIPFGIGVRSPAVGWLGAGIRGWPRAIVPAWIAVGFAAVILAVGAMTAVLANRQLAPAATALRSE